jgi:DNA-binding NtrC family response regulator
MRLQSTSTLLPSSRLSHMADHSRILVVDDETQITRVLRTTLSSHAYDVRVANDGETA